MFDHHPPPPSDPGAETWLGRVEALLAKAESTEFPDEAEALVAKAQELMARHAIDGAMLAAAGRSRAAAVTVEAVTVTAPYASAKANLLGAVAHANTCRVVMTRSGGGDRTCQVVGHRDDLDATTTLYAALILHATRVMLATPTPAGDTARRFRHSFLLAFAARIGERLRAAREHAAAEARRDGGRGVEIVLRDRAVEVDRAFHAAFPRVRTARASSSSLAGHVSGRRAADAAAIGSRRLPGGRRGLGRGRGGGGGGGRGG